MGKHTQRHPVVRIASFGLFAAVVLALSIVPQSVAQGTRTTQDQALARFEQVYRFVVRNYVDEVDPDALIEGAVAGLLESLDDPHTTYLDTEAMRALTDTTSGEFGGVGMYIVKPAGESEDATHIEVVSPIEGTPADRAGLRTGDLIVRVDGTSTLGLSSDDVVGMLRGRPGSNVEIRVRRSAQVEFDIVIEREIIRLPTVRWDMIDDEIAFLRIVQFTPFTDDAVEDALEAFEAADYSSMIIDLRTNPGGLLDGVVDVADLFFDDGLIVETRGRVAGENQRFYAEDGMVWRAPKETLHPDGSKTISIGYPVCTPHEAIGDQGAEVEDQKLFLFQGLRHVALDNALRQPFDDGGLADAGLADQHRVVLGAARQHLHGAADLLVSADHRVDFAVERRLRQIAGKLLQRVVLVLRADAVGRAPLAEIVDRPVQALRRHARVAQNAAGRRSLRQSQRQEKALRRDEAIAGSLGQLFRLLEQTRGFRSEIDLPGARPFDTGNLGEFGLDGLQCGGGMALGRAYQPGGEPFLVVKQNFEDVFRLKPLMVRA